MTPPGVIMSYVMLARPDSCGAKGLNLRVFFIFKASRTVAAKAARKVSVAGVFLRDHEVSSLMTNGAGDALWLGWCFGLGLPPRAKTSTTLMHPPQQGHGRSSLKGSSAGGVSCGGGAAAGALSNSRALAIASARLPLARKPAWRMRCP